MALDDSIAPAERAHRLLERAAPLLRLPTSPDRPPEVLLDGSGPSAVLKTGLRCSVTGRIFSYRDGAGILHVDGHEPTPRAVAGGSGRSAWADLLKGAVR